MYAVGFDAETYLITKSNPVPKPVCCTWYDGNRRWITTPGEPATYAVLARPDTVLVGHHVVYDLLVMMRWQPETVPLIIQMADEGRIRDTDTREALWYLQEKGGFGFPDQFSLADLVKKYRGIDISEGKEDADSWRLRYGTLDGVPFARWPKEALDYAMDDAVWAYCVGQDQGMWQTTLPTEELQIRGALALGGTSAWGFTINQEVRQTIEQTLTHKIRECDQLIGHLGWSGTGSEARFQTALREAWNYKQAQQIQTAAQMNGWSIDWSRWRRDADVREMVESGDIGWFGGDVELLRKMVSGKKFPAPQYTNKKFKGTGQRYIKADDLAIRQVADCYFVQDQQGNNHHAFETLQHRKHYNKLLSTYCKALAGYDVIHAGFRNLVSTGRTGCREPNLQNWPARDDLPMRDMFCARPNRLLGTVDWGALELGALAAVMRIYWPNVRSILGEVLDRGDDPHCLTASIFLNKPYEEIYAGRKGKYKDVRQGSKASNFGFPGGLQINAFLSYAESTYGVKMTYQEGLQYHRGWCKTYPEIPGVFLKYCKDQVPNFTDTATAVLPNGRMKADCRYTQFANFHFQGLSADGAKEALYAMWRECMLGGYYRRRPHAIGYGSDLRDGYLSQSHTVNFVHDETICEHPEGRAGELALKRQGDIMITEMSKMFQHKVPVIVESHLGPEWAH